MKIAIEVRPQRILGIFGGMGPEATINFYNEIVRLTPAQKDQDHIPTLIYSFPQVPDRTTVIKSGDRSIIPYLQEGVRRLEEAGASFIAIPCVTAHFFYNQMRDVVKIPIIHVIIETVQAVCNCCPGCKTVGLLASSGTIETGLYEKEFRARNITTIVPDPETQKNCVMKTVYGIKAGNDKKEYEELLFTALEELYDKDAQVIVLGCTEIPIVFNTQWDRIPVVNSTRVLAEAAIRYFRGLASPI